MDKRSYLCQHCGKCCDCLVLPVQRPIEKSIFLGWLHARGGKIVAETPETLYVKLNTPCPRLEKSKGRVTCRGYEDRPQGCRIFDGTTVNWLKCLWKDPYSYVISNLDLIKRGTHSVGFAMKRPHSGKVRAIGVKRKPPYSSDQKKRLARRRAIQAREDRAEDIRAYGRPLED